MAFFLSTHSGWGTVRDQNFLYLAINWSGLWRFIFSQLLKKRAVCVVCVLLDCSSVPRTNARFYFYKRQNGSSGSSPLGFTLTKSTLAAPPVLYQSAHVCYSLRWDPAHILFYLDHFHCMLSLSSATRKIKTFWSGSHFVMWKEDFI